MKFISAKQVGRSIIYTGDDGTQIKYSGGDPAWRANHPGNLWPGSVSKRNGAIGKFDHFVVFPDYETGHRALLDSLKTTHWDKSLKRMIGSYAPSVENNTKRYLRFLQKNTGVKDALKIKSFSSEQFEKLLQAIETYEGKKKGKIEDVTPINNPKDKKQIIHIQKNKKGTIVAYEIEEMGWVTKEQGIKLALAGEIDAVVATSRAGHLFLRTRPRIEIVNLEDLG